MILILRFWSWLHHYREIILRCIRSSDTPNRRMSFEKIKISTCSYWCWCGPTHFLCPMWLYLCRKQMRRLTMDGGSRTIRINLTVWPSAVYRLLSPVRDTLVLNARPAVGYYCYMAYWLLRNYSAARSATITHNRTSHLYRQIFSAFRRNNFATDVGLLRCFQIGLSAMIRSSLSSIIFRTTWSD